MSRALAWLDDKRAGLIAWWSNPFRRYWPHRPKPKQAQAKRRTP